MKNKAEFNTPALAEALKRAKGDRTITQFAHDAGITYQYLSSLLNCKRSKPPMLKTLKMISNVSQNAVDFSELCDICGYDSSEVSGYSGQGSGSEPESSVVSHNSDLVRALMLLYFDKSNIRHYGFSDNQSDVGDIRCDFMVDEPFKNCIFFMVDQKNNKTGSYMNQILESYGIISTIKHDDNRIIAFICFDDKALDELKETKPVAMPINAIAYVVELDNFRIRRSEVLSIVSEAKAEGVKRLLF